MTRKASQAAPALRKYKDENSVIRAKMQEQLDTFTDEFEKDIIKKKSQFLRYLETRVNWLNKELSAKVPDAESWEMNNIDFLRLYDPHCLPEELRGVETDTEMTKAIMTAPATVLKTLRKRGGTSVKFPRTLTTSRTATRRTTRTTTAAATKRVPNTIFASTPRSVTSVPTPKQTLCRPVRITRTAKRSGQMLSVFRSQSPVSTNLLTQNQKMVASTPHLETSLHKRLAHYTQMANKGNSEQLSNVTSQSCLEEFIQRNDSVVFSSRGSPIRNPFAYMNPAMIQEVQKLIAGFAEC